MKIGNDSEDEGTIGNEEGYIKTLKHRFSFQNSKEFRCITQAELDILKWEEQNAPCSKTCNMFVT